MHAKLFLVGLAAAAVSASPLIARQGMNSTAGRPASSGSAKATLSSSTMASSSTGSAKTTMTSSTVPVSMAPSSTASLTTMATSIMSTASAAATASVVPNPAVSQDLINRLELAANTVDRFTILQNEDPTHLKFDFNPAANPAVAAGLGGQVDLAFRKNFPAVIDLGISAAVGLMNPCGLNTPHIHPRASEFLTVVQGHIQSGFILENGFTTQQNTTLSPFQGTVFPQGSIHFQQNLDCTPSVFVSGLNSEDPGASSIAQNFFAVDPAILDATLGFPKQIDANNFADFKSHIPAPFVKGIESCLKRCNIPY